MATTSSGVTPREQLVLSFDEWADQVRELLTAVRPALEVMDYEMAATAFEGLAKGAATIGVRVRGEADKRKEKGW